MITIAIHDYIYKAIEFTMHTKQLFLQVSVVFTPASVEA